ncbi:MAG: hypothetical protein FXF54_14445 [Kosmotoga sp.]|nr:MAG: hypothetical protein FXF54_14445 [Kosmotoga sp.]
MPSLKRNFIGEKDLSRKIGSFKLAAEVVKSGNEETMQKMAQAVRMLADFAKDEYNLKNIAKLERSHMEDFANYLLEKVDGNEISTGHTANIISSLNSMFNYFYKDDLKLSAREYGLSRGKQFSGVDKSVSDDLHNKFVDFLMDKFTDSGDSRYEALRLQVELQRNAGLRFKESALFSGRELGRNGELSISKGTKGGQPRTFNATDKQKELISSIKVFRKESNFTKSLIPNNMSFKEWRHFAYYATKEFNNKNNTQYNFHGERHHYAQNRYKELMGHEPPVKGMDSKEIPVKEENSSEIEYQARMQISEELGHHRLDITSHYLGKG